MILLVCFVVVTLLLIVAAMGGNFVPEANRPYYHSGSFVLVVIDLCILGYKVFGVFGK